MSEFINTIDLLGDEVVFKSIVERSITEFKDDVLTTIGNGSFRGCASLVEVDLPNVTTIQEQAFANCTALTTLILRSNNICVASGSLIFYGTSPHNIYVPDDLAESYKSATNWSAFASQIKPLSELGE